MDDMIDSYTPALRDHLESEAQACERDERDAVEVKARHDDLVADLFIEASRDTDEVSDAIGWGFDAHPDYPPMPSVLFQIATSGFSESRRSMNQMREDAKAARTLFQRTMLLKVGEALVSEDDAELGRLVRSYARPYLMRVAQRAAEREL